MSKKKEDLETSFINVKKIYDDREKSLGFDEVFKTLESYNVEAYRSRANGLKQKISDGKSALQKDYQKKSPEIESIGNKINDSSRAYACAEQTKALKKIDTMFAGYKLPEDEIRDFTEELNRLSTAIKNIELIKEKLEEMQSADGFAGKIAKEAIKIIGQHPIASLSDVDTLISLLEYRLTESKDANFRINADKISGDISRLNGIIESCGRFRAYKVDSTYRARSYKDEIQTAAEKIISGYKGLDEAEYTTCENTKIAAAIKTAQEVSIKIADDKITFDRLKRLIRDYETYKSDDDLLRPFYNNYEAKVKELKENGISIDDIGAFNPKNYDAQKRALNERLLKKDFNEAAAKTKETFVRAVQTMKESGYEMLLGDLDSDGDSSAESMLAREAIFVKPGCDGVVWRILAYDCNMRRSIMGIERISGTLTSDARIKEIAKIDENDGGAKDFFEKYNKNCGENSKVTEAYDIDTEGCDERIKEIGHYRLTEESEKLFDELINNGTKEDRARYAAKITAPIQVIAESRRRDDAENEKQRASEAVKALYQSRRSGG
ncbi:MAG: hypothetical protein LBP62_05925 [Clostridiales bacterium]|nr:hypothetical protein [Clostridiales bacterium]